MNKFTEDAKELLKAVGGKNNIVGCSHCATRLRFVLQDNDKADKKALESISSVKGVFINAGQFQAIIGNEVASFYNEFVNISGISENSTQNIKNLAKQNQTLLQNIIGFFAEIFAPIIPAVIVGGLILGFRNILEAVPMDFLDGKTIIETSVFWSGINRFLWLPGEAIFHFLPVGICWSVTRRMGGTQILGIVLGITLVSPQLLNAYAVNSAELEVIKNYTIDFGFTQLFLRGYQAQVIPSLLAALLFVYLERFFRKITPEAIQMILVPLFSLVPTILMAHLILGPFGWMIGSYVSSVVNFGLSSSFSWIFALIFGAFYAPLVITGLHHTMLAIDFQLIADFGYTNLWTMICLSNIAQGAASIGYFMATKQDKQVAVPATISAWLGVTEPAMFGVNLKYVYPFVSAMIGSSIAALFITIFKVKALSIGVGGLPGILAITPSDWSYFIVGMLIAISVPILLTIFIVKINLFKKWK